MPAGVVVDTSFLITLADPTRVNHAIARRYWRHFSEQGLPIFLPTIVVSEFCIRQEIPAEILRSCVVLPFNWDDAIQAAKVDFSKIDRDGQSRQALKDDVKILAQAMVKDAALLITDDKNTLYKFAMALDSTRESKVRPIKLDDGFDLAFFDPNGQGRLEFANQDFKENDNLNET